MHASGDALETVHNGNAVKEQWKHSEILNLEGSTQKGAGVPAVA